MDKIEKGLVKAALKRVFGVGEASGDPGISQELGSMEPQEPTWPSLVSALREFLKKPESVCLGEEGHGEEFLFLSSRLEEFLRKEIYDEETVYILDKTLEEVEEYIRKIIADFPEVGTKSGEWGTFDVRSWETICGGDEVAINFLKEFWGETPQDILDQLYLGED